MNSLRAVILMIRRSLIQHAVAVGVTLLSVAVATGLVMAVFSLETQSRRAFTSGATGFDAVLGARGSQLQLVLNAIFHLETSPGNLPWALYEQIRKDPRVSAAVPCATGDNFRGFHIVGTAPELFDSRDPQGQSVYRLPQGHRMFDAMSQEAVIGSFVARRTGLKVGDVFQPYHGLSTDESSRHDEDYVVTGILEPTNTPSDRAIFIPIEGIFRMGGHVLRGTGSEYKARSDQMIPDEHKEVSSVLIRLKNPQSGFSLNQMINRQGKVATLAWPIGGVMADLFDKLGWMALVLRVVAWLVVLVAGCTILASIYNTMNERRREFAILRALGATRRVIFSAVVIESGLIALLGSLLGLLVSSSILGLASIVIRAKVGVVIQVWEYHPMLGVTPVLMTVIGVLAGFLPAFKAYRTDVAHHLAAHS